MNIKKILKSLILLLFVIIIPFNYSSGNFVSKNKKIILTSHWDTTRVLNNPHKGWYHHLLDNGINKYSIKDDSIFMSFPGMDHLYLRLAWSYLEPEEGEFDWHYIDEVVEKYVPLGYQIAFRITSKETGTYPGSVGQELDGVQYATPIWVEKAGAKGKIVENRSVKSWMPDWDDPVYLDKLDQFHEAFAERYDEEKWAIYIDVGSIGEWGEGHTSSSTCVPPTIQEVKANINIYLKNYKHTQLVVTDDLIYYGKPDIKVKGLYNYVVDHGFTLRDDSPLVDWYLQQNLDTWSVSHPHFYDPLYLEKPIIFELQHYGSVKRDGNWVGENGTVKLSEYRYSGAKIMREAIKTMHASYIGYHGFAEEWLGDNPKLTRELANLCGYWYFPESINITKAEKSRLSFTIKWLNKGVAPAYFSYMLKGKLTNINYPEEVITFDISDSGNKNWLPQKMVTEYYSTNFSLGLKGNYELSIQLYDTKSKRLVEIGLNEKLRDEAGFFTVAEVGL